MKFRSLLKWWLALAGAALVLRLATGASPARQGVPGAEGRPTTSGAAL